MFLIECSLFSIGKTVTSSWDNTVHYQCNSIGVVLVSIIEYV